jgi:hypothetical protein
MSVQTDIDGDPVRTSWFGMNQPRPELPYYLRPGKRLKGLDEFERPQFASRVPRVRRRRELGWYALVGVAIAAGTGVSALLVRDDDEEHRTRLRQLWAAA